MAMFLDGDDKEGFLDNKSTKEVKDNLKIFFDRIKKFVDSSRSNTPIDISIHNSLAELSIKSELLQEDVFKELTKFGVYLIENISGTNYLNFSASLKREKTDEEFFDFYRKLDLYTSQLDQLSDYHQKWLDRVHYIQDRINLRNELIEEINNVKAAKLAIESNETDKIYLGLSEKYKFEYYRNNGYFFITLIIVGCVSWYYSASLEQISNFTNGVLIAFIAFKILLISIAITLITLFLRRSSHAKKLQDQAYQTHVEISAFPLYVRSLKEDDQHALVKELAMKYFGKELDHSQTDKAGDLMAEQIRISTEMVKASAEMVKSLKPSGASESSEPK